MYQGRKEKRMTKLYSFDWCCSHSSASECFEFFFGKPHRKEDDGGHYMNARFYDYDIGEGENGDYAELFDVPISESQWGTLEKALFALSLPCYTAPDEHLLDATNSKIDILLLEDGEISERHYNGEYAHEFRHFLQEFAKSVDCPAEPSN